MIKYLFTGRSLPPIGGYVDIRARAQCGVFVYESMVANWERQVPVAGRSLVGSLLPGVPHYQSSSS